MFTDGLSARMPPSDLENLYSDLLDASRQCPSEHSAKIQNHAWATDCE